MQTPKRKRYQKDSASSDDILTLIHLVRQNPAIYNYKLRPHRRRVDVISGWTQIAAQIGKEVEECRRKWKNLRDTYHQYRLRKSKPGDGLSKWRYAKDLEFLSTVYQPKLKSQRKQNFDVNSQILQVVSCSDTNTTQNSDEMLDHPDITLVHDDAETFILTAYEESVNDDVTMDQATVHELTHHSHDDGDVVEQIVKNEHACSLDGVVDDDVATGTEVDYEEVCLYEEACNAHTTTDCDAIINTSSNGGGSSNCITQEPRDEKEYQYIDASEFCMDTKLKNIMGVVTNSTCDTNGIESLPTTSSISSAPLIQFQTPIASSIGEPVNGHIREELDLFFDFLKKKMQHFSKEEISAIQIDILRAVLQREQTAQKVGTSLNNGMQ